MNFKTTLTLLVLVIAGGMVWWLAGKTPVADTSSDESKKPESRYVLESKPSANDIKRLTLERPGKPKLTFERTLSADAASKPEDWRMVEPFASATESYVVNGLVTMLTGLQYTREVKTGDKITLADAGLEPPQAIVTITDKGDKEYKVDIGKKQAVGNDTYVRVAGAAELKAVGRDLAFDVKKELNDFRAKAIMKDMRSDKAKKLRIEFEGKTYELTRGSDAEWVFDAPAKAHADKKKVLDLLSTLNRVRVSDFVSDTPATLAEYGLEKPYLSLEVTTEDQKLVATSAPSTQSSQPIEPKFETVTQNFKLLVGDYSDMGSTKRYLKLPDAPWVASAEKATLEALAPKMTELRDAHVTRVKAANVNAIDIYAGKEHGALKRPQGGTWQGADDLSSLDADTVKDVLQAFEDLTAVEFIDAPEAPEKYGLKSPRATLVATSEGQVEPLTLAIGDDTPSGRNTYVQIVGQPSVLVVSAQQAQRLAISPLALRSREIFSLPPDDLRSVELNREGKKFSLALTNGKWTLKTPEDVPADPGSVRELVNDLAKLRAKTVVAKGDFAKYGLEKPAVTVMFTVEVAAPAPQPSESQPASVPVPAAEKKSEIHKIAVGRVGEKTFCRKDNEPYVYELDETLYKVFTGELIERGLFQVAADDIVGIRVDAPGGMVDFEKSDGQWKYLPDPTVKVSKKKVEDFATEIAKLRVSGFIAYNDGDITEAGLENSPVTVVVRMKDKSTITLKLDQVRRGELPRKAAWVEMKRLFLLKEADVEKLLRGLDAYLGPEKPAAEPAHGAAPGAPLPNPSPEEDDSEEPD